MRVYYLIFTFFVFWQMSAVAQADEVTPPSEGYASDRWLQDDTPWSVELERREKELLMYLGDNDPSRAQNVYGFDSGHHPALAWNWFDQHPVGFSGVPNVLLQTLMSLDPETETDPLLIPIARIWRQKSILPFENGKATLDHLGAGPHPSDYVDGIAKSPERRNQTLPNGFVFDPSVVPENVLAVNARLWRMRRLDSLTLIRSGLRKMLFDDEINYQTEVQKLQTAPKVDAVFFACSACHVGRVITDGSIDAQGNKVGQGKVKFLPGMPNTEIEAQHYSELLLHTGLALIESGFSINSVGLPNPDDIKPRRKVVKALYLRMIDRARNDNLVRSIYGPTSSDIKRAKIQTYWVAKDFAKYIADLIGTAVKTQFIYQQIGGKFAYNPNNPLKKTPSQKIPHLMNGRPGQMDAFGIASGLVAIHTARPDGSYVKFMHDDYPENPLFTGMPEVPGFETPATPEEVGRRIMQNIEKWVPKLPAPIDIKSLNWAGQRKHANWDGNQGAAARALASGTSATGSPLETNVRIHQPLNPFINNLPPPAYPFAIDKAKAVRGMQVFKDKNCSACHKPNNEKIFSSAKLSVDENRSLLITEVSRFGLAGMVMESCRIFMRKNPGNDWCLPRDDQGQVITDTAVAYDDFFRDIPERIKAKKNGYKADMLHGIWARAPYLHNGSVPTLLQLMCPGTRPAKFKRGNIYYDQKMVGFEWDILPKQRYSEHEMILIKEYDTAEFGRSNTGHDFGSDLCPDTSGLDPINDRQEINDRVLPSSIGDLLEYLKTL